jgi:hypothetical protein
MHVPTAIVLAMQLAEVILYLNNPYEADPEQSADVFSFLAVIRAHHFRRRRSKKPGLCKSSEYIDACSCDRTQPLWWTNGRAT